MTFIKEKTFSSIKCDLLDNKASASISGTITGHYDRTQISNTDVTSTNDYQFTLSSSSGSSFLVTAAFLLDNSGTTPANITFQWYDETNTQYIGGRGFLSNYQNNGSTDPWLPTVAQAMILSSDFGGSDITISLRVISETGTGNTFPGSSSFSGGRNPHPVFRIWQT